MSRLAGICLILLSALPVAAAGGAREVSPKLPGPVPLRTWTTNGPVRAILPAAGRIYLGGDFTNVGPRASPVLSILARKGRLDGKFPQISGGAVLAVEPDGRGGVFLGGYFKHVGLIACRSLAHVLASGAVDSRWCPGPNGSVDILTHKRGRLYFAGDFTRVRGARRRQLAAVSIRTGRLTAWRPAIGRNDRLRGLAVSGNTVFAAGDFRSFGGRPVHNLAALDARTGRVRRWNARLDRTGCSTREPCQTQVWAVATRGDTVYIVGNFDLVRGKKRVGLAALSARTGQVMSWRANIARPSDFDEWRLVPSRSRLYIVGLFSRINGVRRDDGVAAVDGRTGRVLRWQPRLPESLVSNVAVGSNGVLVSYEDADGDEEDHLRLVDAGAGRRIRWSSPHLSSGEKAVVFEDIALSGKRLVAATRFATVIGRRRRDGLASFDPRSRRMTAWAPRLNGRVLTMAETGTTLYVGGCFRRVNGQARNSLAAFDLRTGRLLPWNPNANPPCVAKLVVSGSTVYFAGEMTTVGGVARRALAAVDATTGALEPWNPAPSHPSGSGDDAEVFALSSSGSTIYVGGRFTAIGGGTRANLAAFDTATGAVTGWNPNVDEAVYAVEPARDTIFVGGAFAHVGPTTRTGLAQIDAATGSATAFDPKARFDSADLTLRPLGDVLFVGANGEVSFAGKYTGGIAALDASTGRVFDWPGFRLGDDGASAVARAKGRLYVGAGDLVAGYFLVFPF